MCSCLYISEVKLKAESHILVGSNWYAPLIVLPLTGLNFTLPPAWIISQGTDGYVREGIVISVPHIFSYINDKNNALDWLSTVTT